MAMNDLPQSKCCPKCNFDRPLDRYYNYHAQCKNCLSDWQREYFRQNPHKRKSGHNLDESGYIRLFAEQGGQCAICGACEVGGRAKRLVVDHCHSTGRVRGLLCHNCNIGIGMLKDDTDRLLAAIKYLKRG